MEKKIEKQKISSRGGARVGSGRKKGGTNNFTIETLLIAVQQKANGQPYEQLLAEDFIQARMHDKGLAQKYHHLILSKVAPSLAKIETNESEDSIQTKQQAFADALLSLTKNTKND
jgi:hypothetical protein